MATAKCSNACPVQVATIETRDGTSFAMLDAEEVREIIKKNEIEDMPVALLAIVGVARKGKSFFLNMLIAYFKHKSQFPNSDFKTSSYVISGKQWAGGRQSATQGIWIWDEAFIIRRPDKTKIAILLADTQGICDGVKSARQNVDSQIIYMTLSMATIYIHNIDKEWRKEEREVYQICKCFDEIYGGVNLLVNSFTLLYRNWVEDRDFGCRPDVLNDEIKAASQDDVASKVLKGINELFRYKTSWVLPEPSDCVRNFQRDETILIAEVGDGFLNEFVRLAEQLFGTNGYYSQHMNSAVTGKAFVEMMEDLSERLRSWPDLTANADQLKDLYVKKAYELAKDEFQDKLKSEIENSDDLLIIQKWFNEAKATAIGRYKEHAKNVKHYDRFYCHYLEKLKAAIDKKREAHRHIAELRSLIKEREKLSNQLTRLRQKIKEMEEIFLPTAF